MTEMRNRKTAASMIGVTHACDPMHENENAPKLSTHLAEDSKKQAPAGACNILTLK